MNRAQKLVLTVGTIIAIAVAGSPVLATGGGNDNEKKTTICHVPPGNPGNAHTITISDNALKAHLGDNEQGLHGGDYRGECRPVSTPVPSAEPTAEPTVIPTPTPEVTPTPEPTVTPVPSETPSVTPEPTVTPRQTMPPTDTAG
jgi:outer membrane biosynthesis protein TonB